MPRQAKRPKLQPEAEIDAETSLDPLKNITSHLHDHIFQHLSGSEVINCSSVSSSWNHSLSVSSQAISKIKLVLSDDSFPAANEMTINFCKRRYRNAEVTLYRQRKALKIMLIVKEISESLENLQVDGNNEFFLKLPLGLKFPKLKTLKLVNFQIDPMHLMLSWTYDRLLEVTIKVGIDPFFNPFPTMTAKLTSLDIRKCKLSHDCLLRLETSFVH